MPASLGNTSCLVATKSMGNGLNQRFLNGFGERVHAILEFANEVCHINGNQTWTSEPFPGTDINSNPPPASAARSSMLNKPKVAPRTASSQTARTSNPD